MNAIRRRKVGFICLTVVAFGLLAAGVVAVHAQSGGGYDLTWNTADGGGTTFSSGGGYTLGGTAGQPDAAVWSGGGASPPLSTGYTLAGGFWNAGAAGGSSGGATVYLPLILKGR